MNSQVKKPDNTVVLYPASVPPTTDGYTNYLDVPNAPARAAGDTTSVLTYQNGAYAWVAPTPTLKTLSAGLNKELTTLFKTAPIWLQVVYSNIMAPIAAMITAGQLATAIAVLQGVIDNKQVPDENFPLIISAIALITAQEPAFAAVLPVVTPAAPAP